jgi:signal peptidase
LSVNWRKSDWSGLPEETLTTFRALMREQGKVVLKASGFSMYPYIRPGDICRFAPLRRPLRTGEIGLVVSDRGLLYSHRLQEVVQDATGIRYRFRGDFNPHYDNPVGPDRIVGILTGVLRKGRTLRETRPGRQLWAAAAVKGSTAFRICAWLAERLMPKSTGHRKNGGAHEEGN